MENIMKRITIGNLLNYYLSYCKNEFKENTYSDKKSSYDKLLSAGLDSSITADSLTPTEAEKIFLSASNTLTANSHNKLLSHISTMWEWAQSYELLTNSSPFGNIPKMAHIPQPIYLPTIGDFITIFTHADETTRLILMTALTTGARKTDLTRIRSSDILEHKGLLRVRKHRHSQHYPLIINQTIPFLLIHYLKQYQKDKYNFNLTFERHPLLHRKGNHHLNTICNAQNVKPFELAAVSQLGAQILLSNGGGWKKAFPLLLHEHERSSRRYVDRTEYLRTQYHGESYQQLVLACLTVHGNNELLSLVSRIAINDRNGSATDNFLKITLLCKELIECIQATSLPPLAREERIKQLQLAWEL